MRLAAFAAAALSSVLGACTVADRAPPATIADLAPSQCFHASDVTGFRVPTDRVVYISTARGDTLRLDTLVDCSRARSASTVGFSTLPGGDRVCRGDEVALVVPDASFPQRCPVSSLRRLSLDEVAALTAEERP